MPSITSRRAFLSGTATAATAIAAGCSPAALAAANRAAPDPALDAIAHYRDVHARWLAKLARVTKAHNAACREVGPEPVVTFGRVSERVRSHLRLEEMARKAIKHGLAPDELKAAWDTADQAIAEWRERLQEASIRHGVGELEAVANSWCGKDSVALRKAFATSRRTGPASGSISSATKVRRATTALLTLPAMMSRPCQRSVFQMAVDVRS